MQSVSYPQEVGPLLEDDQSLLWVDAEAPTPDELEWVQAQFKIHRIAMEDYNSPEERARIDRYENYYSIVFYALSVIGDDCKLKERPLTIFIGERFMVTLHADAFPELDEACRLWKRDCADQHTEIGLALYAVMDTLIDDYFPLIDRITDDLDRIFRLKRELLLIRRNVSPERDVLNVLLRRELPLYSEHTQIYFQDLYDHLVRVLDSLDTHREMLAGALDLYVSVSSNKLATSANQLNKTMQILAAWSIILMSSALIAGIYGMNFEIMPELKWKYGYAWALGSMATLGSVLFVYFRRKNWL
jgi:magnesium transporter